MSRRLSRTSLPRPSATSTFARPILEVELRRDERQAPLAHLAVEGLDLAPLQQQLAVAHRIVVLQARLVVRLDVRPDEPGLPVAHVCVGLLQAHAPLAEGLDLAPGEDEAGFEPLDEVVVVPRLAVSAMSFSPFATAARLSFGRPAPPPALPCGAPLGSDGLELDLALRAADVLYEHVDLVPEPKRAAAPPADQRGAQLVDLEVVPAEAAHRQVALEDPAEADEEAGRDDADDLAVVGLSQPRP